MKNLHAVAIASLTFSILMVATADPFPRGRMVQLTSPGDVYRFARSSMSPMVAIAYRGQAGVDLRTAVAQRAPLVPQGLFLALESQGLLETIPAELFRETPIPELGDEGMETIAFAVSSSGERLRWTTTPGPEALALSADPQAQADAIIAFMQT